MLKIGITGGKGFIGWHLRSFLHAQKDTAVIVADRDLFASEEALAGFAASCDVIVHLAGMNRGNDSDVAGTNIRIVETLVRACRAAGSRPHIIFSSSTHIYRDTPYGNSKKICAGIIQKWAAEENALFTNLVLPNIFGEGGKPFYNSVVSTFCFQLANGQKPRIIDDAAIEILHAQRVARNIFSLIGKRTAGEVRLPGESILVSQLSAKLTEMAGAYAANEIPELGTPRELDLFNTYRSYLFPAKYPVNAGAWSAGRGGISAALKSLNGGTSAVSAIAPGGTAGNHYHTRKIERLAVLEGSALVRVRKLFSDKIDEFALDGASPRYIDIPTLHAYSVVNNGKGRLKVLSWANKASDPDNSDTFQETV